MLPVMPVPISYTLTFAVAGIPLVIPGRLAIVIAPGGMTFAYIAAGAPAGVVTLTVIVHDELGGIVPPVKVTVVLVFETVPVPQVVAAEPAT